MTKVIKCHLISRNEERNLDYKQVYKILWELQRETRGVANRCIQLSWEYNNFESDWYSKYKEYPSKEQRAEVTGGYGSMSGVIYSVVSKEFNKLMTGNLSGTVQNATKKFSNLKSDIYKGNISLPSYKSDIPIDVSKKAIELRYEEDNSGNGVKDWLLDLSLLSRTYSKELGQKNGKLTFKIVATARAAGTVRTILERCYDGVYTISGSQLKYDKGKWYILLCYSFDKKPEELPKNNIMGVHIGEQNAVTVSFSNSRKQLSIDGGEVQAFAIQIERRKRNIQNATSKRSVLCGGGRCGHGYKTKMQPLEHINDKISNFRNTTNHKYSREIVNWAIQNKCGVIQLEDLTGWATEELERYTLLKNWSYFDLMNKIEYKAKEAGIKVVKIPYKPLHSWCCDCESATVIKQRDEEDNITFVCEKCGQLINRDEHILRALIIPDIDKVIKEKAKEKDEQEE